MNLANALTQQGLRSADKADAFFAPAVEVYRRSFAYYTRERQPEGWALVQGNLGNVLRQQALRSEGAARSRLLQEGLSTGRAMKMRWSAVALLLLLLATDVAAAQARRELVGRIFHRGANDEEILERGVPVTLEPSGAATRSNDQGIFRLPLPAFVRPDDVVTLVIDKEGWRIRYPLDGELRLPAEPGRQVVPVELLPAGSKLFWSNDRIEKFIGDAIRQSARQAADRFETTEDQGLDFSRAIRDWAERYGLSAEMAKQEIDTWIAEVKTAADADERRLGLAAFAEQQFEKAARHFGSAAAAGVAELAEIERAAKTLEGKKEEARQAVVINYGNQGFAEFNARRYEAAIAAFESALRHVSSERERQTWASLWKGIGMAHLGEISRGPGPALQHHLVSSVAAHRKVLEAIPRESLPRDWARIQCIVGTVFLMRSVFSVGESESALAEAFSSFRSALAVLSREKDPQDWATAQRHLGNAFELQALRNPAAEKSRQEALAAYQNALGIFTRQDFPEDWATLQTTVGSLLLGQARRATEDAAAKELLSRSLSAYRSALEVFTRERHPRQWASAQASLERVQSELSSRSDAGIAATPLEDIVLARRDALAAHVREKDPMLWALAQIHLGEALLKMGKLKPGEEGKRLLEEAAERLIFALEVCTREGAPILWASVESVLGFALQEQGMRTPGEAGSAHLGEASESFRRSLEVFDRDQFPAGWAGIHASLGDVLVERGRRAAEEERTRLLGEAVSAYSQALEVFTRESFPKEWAELQSKLESVLHESGSRPEGEAKAKTGSRPSPG